MGQNWPVVVSLANTRQWGEEHFQNSLQGGGHGGPSLKCSWKALGWEVSLVQAPRRHPWLLTGHWEFVALEMVLSLGSFTPQTTVSRWGISLVAAHRVTQGCRRPG